MTDRRRVLDVEALPTHAFGHRDPLWWAVILLVCIEGTMLVLHLQMIDGGRSAVDAYHAMPGMEHDSSVTALMGLGTALIASQLHFATAAIVGGSHPRFRRHGSLGSTTGCRPAFPAQTEHTVRGRSA